MLPDRVLNPGPLTYESGALPIALRGLAGRNIKLFKRTSHIYTSVAYPLARISCEFSVITSKRS